MPGVDEHPGLAGVEQVFGPGNGAGGAEEGQGDGHGKRVLSQGDNR